MVRRPIAKPPLMPLARAIRLVLASSVLISSSAFAADVPLASLNGTNGFRIDGAVGGGQAGRAVASGDINGDGIGDLILGASYAGAAGAVYVVFGRNTGFASTLQLSTLDGNNGFRIDGVASGDRAGTSVAAVDLNGDGEDDVVVGAPGGDPQGPPRSGAGKVHVVFGKTSGFGSAISLATLTPPNGFALNGVAVADYAGTAVAGLGDVNGDNKDDLLIGAGSASPLGRNQAGSSYVVFGQSSFANPFELSSLNGANGFRLDGGRAYDRSGSAVGKLGDINGDTFDDLIVGAPYYRIYSPNSGRAYVVFGRSNLAPFPATLDLAALNGANGFLFHFPSGLPDRLGTSVSGAGNVNGDGFGDLLVGAPTYGNYSGRVWLVFGRSTFPAAIDGTLGTSVRFSGETSSGRAGASTAAVGDFNGDGFADFMVGSPYGSPNGINSAGRTHVIFGRASFGADPISLATISGNTGFEMAGVGSMDRSGHSVAAVGDVNGDHGPDLLIGTLVTGSGAGQGYVVFSSSEITATPAPGAGTIVLNDVVLDGITTTHNIVLGNSGGADLVVRLLGAPPLSAPLSATLPPPPTVPPKVTIPAQGSAILTVGCQATAAGKVTGTLDVTTNDPDEGVLSYNVECNGQLPNFASEPPPDQLISLAAAPGGSDSEIVTLRNTGTAPLDIANCVEPSPGFSVTGASFPITIPATQPASSVALTVSCTAPAAGTNFTGTLSCTGIDDLDKPNAEYPLRCDGLAAPAARFSSTPPQGSTLSISGTTGVIVGTRKVRVTNTGVPGSSLGVSNCIFSTPEFSVAPPTLNLAQGASADLTVSCQLPATAGQTVSDSLICSTTDVARPSVGFSVDCTRPQLGIAFPEDPLADPGAEGGENLGRAVAVADATATSPEIFVVGAPAPLDGSGEVRIYVGAPGGPSTKETGDIRSLRALDGNSEATAILTVNGGQIGDKFGQSVAISPDGNTIVVGSPGRSNDVGGTFVFTKPAGASWVSTDTLAATLLPVAPAAGTQPRDVGDAVAIGADGTVLVGAPESNRDVGTGAQTGASGVVYVYSRLGGNFTQTMELKPVAGQSLARFGSAIATASGLLAIGAPEEDDGQSLDEGALYAYPLTGGTIGPVTRVTKAGGGIGDKFGSSVAVRPGLVVVGAPGATTLSGAQSGAAIVIRQAVGGELTQVATLEPPLGLEQGAGASVSMNGETIVLGAPLADVNSNDKQGRVLLFNIRESFAIREFPQAVIENPGGEAEDEFGRAVVLGRRHLLIGAYLDDTGALDDVGRVNPYVLDRVHQDGFE